MHEEVNFRGSEARKSHQVPALTKKRKVLGDLSREEASNRRRRVPDLLPSGRQNMDIVEETYKKLLLEEN